MIRYTPPPIEGAPAYVVWIMGIVLIALAITLVWSLVAIAIFVYNDARGRRTWPVVWLIAAIIGGWLTLLAWMVLRERFTDLTLEMIMDKQEPEGGSGL